MPRMHLLPDEHQHQQSIESLICQQMAAAGGALPFDRFMELALYAPGMGYYSGGALKFGKGGDFVTAPEISPVFGQCVANQCQQVLERLPGGSILEFGAGSGRLAVDVLARLQVLDALPQEYLILELSAELRDRQQQLLARCLPELLSRVRWLDRLPDHFSGVVLANEVLDAMPVHRFKLHAGAVQEMFVDWRDGAFAEFWQQTQNPLLEQAVTGIQSRYGELADGYESEVNLRAHPWISGLAQILDRGLILLIDYGYTGAEYYHPERSMGTLICHFRHQAHADALKLVGLQDITANVDFSRVAQAALESGLAVAGYSTQAHFLLGCGLDALLGEQDQADVGRWLDAVQAVKQLTLPSAMGERFKALGLSKQMDGQSFRGFALRDLQERL